MIERISTMVEVLGLTYLIGWFNFGGLPHAAVMKSMERFASDVMPHFAETTATVDVSS